MARTIVTSNCLQCGGEFSRRLRNTRQPRFCDHTCRALYYFGAHLPMGERFIRQIDKTPGQGPWGDCWTWVGEKSDGYGLFYLVPVRRKGDPRMRIRAHRLSYIIHHGPLPDELHVLHRCDFPSCLHPEHLFAGTDQDNSDDKHQKGRGNNLKGSQHPHAKLTDEQVREIRTRYAAGDITQQALSREYGVGHTIIGSVILRKKWTHIA